MTGGLHRAAGALLLALGLACHAQTADERVLQTLRDAAFQPQFLASGLKAPALASGGRNLVLSHRRCLHPTDCELKIQWSLANWSSTDRSCGISAPDVWFLGRGVEQVTWRLDPPPAGQTPEIRFKLVGSTRAGILHFDNTNNPNDGTPFTPLPDVFDVDQQGDGEHRQKISALARGLGKVYYYAVLLQRSDGKGGFEDCQPYDPVVVTRGD